MSQPRSICLDVQAILPTEMRPVAHISCRARWVLKFFFCSQRAVRTSLGCSKRGGGEKKMLHFCTHTCGARHARRAGYQRKLGSACLPASRRIADSNAALRRVRRGASPLHQILFFFFFSFSVECQFVRFFCSARMIGLSSTASQPQTRPPFPAAP